MTQTFQIILPSEIDKISSYFWVFDMNCPAVNSYGTQFPSFWIISKLQLAWINQPSNIKNTLEECDMSFLRLNPKNFLSSNFFSVSKSIIRTFH